MASVKKPKWYVIWVGHAPGVYTTWDKAKAQIHGFPGAQYKSFESSAEAQAAFTQGPINITQGIAARAGAQKLAKNRTMTNGGPIMPSISVDAACDMTSGVMEYRGVDTATQSELFRMGPYLDSSNNLGEFLAVVHALAYCKQNGITLPIYSDSRTAISWVRNKLAKTTVTKTYGNTDVFALIARAETWLTNNVYPNNILKWETKLWGENPADFGRK